METNTEPTVSNLLISVFFDILNIAVGIGI